VTISPGSDQRAEIARLVVSRGWNLLELRQVGMTLEEVFLRVISDTENVQQPDDELLADGATAEPQRETEQV